MMEALPPPLWLVLLIALTSWGICMGIIIDTTFTKAKSARWFVISVFFAPVTILWYVTVWWLGECPKVVKGLRRVFMYLYEALIHDSWWK